MASGHHIPRLGVERKRKFFESFGALQTVSRWPEQR
jgi:hypothetical protein